MNTDIRTHRPRAAAPSPATSRSDDTTRHVTVEHHDGSPLAPDDPRITFLRAAQTARAVIGAIADHDVDRPTPCAGWTVLDVARHMAAVFLRVAAAPTGADVSGPTTSPELGLGAIDDTIGAALAEGHDHWNDADTLRRIIDAPWGPTPGSVCLHIWAAELLMHAWDLAVSIGVSVDWPEPDVTAAVEMTRAGIPAERGADVPFGPVVEVGAEATPIEQLVAWVGRDPSDPIRP